MQFRFIQGRGRYVWSESLHLISVSRPICSGLGVCVSPSSLVSVSISVSCFWSLGFHLSETETEGLWRAYRGATCEGFF